MAVSVGDLRLNDMTMDAPAQKVERLSYCLYRSSAAPGLNAPALDYLLVKSRIRNQELGLSGCLHYENGIFFQWLEGPPSALYPLLSKLEEDSRHINFTVLDQGSLEQRIFDQWQMRFSDSQVASLFNWLTTQNKTEVSADDYAQNVKNFMKSIG
ncbi:BLUF domain-containing protein [Paracoccus haeundaensis]|uniref:BLUF domain-containing protein n=2 Tax=Paracoccus haeundaensis TaxID=225362 RepID=A0A5C4R3V2_9RHOB|nr:BLUF domain-containing protein [Paracoccus haeundaensis]